MNKKLAGLMVTGIVVASSTGIVTFADTVDKSATNNTSNVSIEENVDSNAKDTVKPEANGDAKANESKILISGAGDTTVKVGENFDPLKGVTVKDDKGNDLTKSLKVDGTVDTSKAGTYKLKYSVVDATGQTVSAERVVTVQEGESQNSDITIEHALKDGDKIALGTGVDVEEGVSAKCAKHPDAKVDVKVESGINIDKAGEYPVTYTATCANGESKTETIHVTVGEANGTTDAQVTAVNLNGATYLEINAGDNFNPMEGVNATDQSGNDITKNVTVDGKVDTSKEGTYTLHYIYKDGKGKELCNVARTVVVRPEGAPLFLGVGNTTIKLNDKFDPKEGVKATDKKDGDLTEKIKIEGNVDTSKEGNYTVTYTVTDSENNTSKAERIVTVGEKGANTSTTAKPSAPNMNATAGNASNTSMPKTGAVVTGVAGAGGLGILSSIGLMLRKRR